VFWSSFFRKNFAALGVRPLAIVLPDMFAPDDGSSYLLCVPPTVSSPLCDLANLARYYLRFAMFLSRPLSLKASCVPPSEAYLTLCKFRRCSPFLTILSIMVSSVFCSLTPGSDVPLLEAQTEAVLRLFRSPLSRVLCIPRFSFPAMLSNAVFRAF